MRANRTDPRVGDQAHVLVLAWRDPKHVEAGGSELYLAEVADRLVAGGVRVTHFSAASADLPRSEIRDGVRYLRRGGHLTVYLWAALMLVLRRFGRITAVLEVQNGMPFFARLFTRLPVVVLVHHVHREQWKIIGPILARLGWFLESKAAVVVNRGTRYVAVSEVTREELIELGVRGPDIAIAWNGPPPVPDFTPMGADPDPHLVVLSRLVPHKQVEHALDTVAELRSDFPGLHLTVVGDGWWRDRLTEYAAARGLGDCVTFAGYVSNERKFEILSSAWVHLLPSVKEGWGLAIIEAALVGVPSVAYWASGGVRDSIMDGVTGLLAAGHRDFIEDTRRLLAEPAWRRELGDKARIRAADFNWQSTTETIAEALRVPLKPW